jgi:hypothetical protein
METTATSASPEPRRGKTTADARALVIRALKQADTTEEAFRVFRQLLDQHPHCQTTVDRTYFDNVKRSIETTRTQAEKDKARATEAADVEEAAGIYSREIALLSLVMPNGRTMADCTGTEMGGFGRGFVRLAKKVGERKVGEVLSEAEVRELIAP